MAKIARRLFSWQEVEDLGDLERLQLVLDAVPDERLMRVLAAERGQGRNDYPVRAVWNSILAGVVFGHPSVASLRRELLRNPLLRQVCGFDPLLKAEQAVPSTWAYTRFLKGLLAHRADIQEVFDRLVKALGDLLPDFGRVLAVDGKAIPSHARSHEDHGFARERDGRRDVDATWGAKTYRGLKADGTVWKQVRSWFGFKLHLIADATHELPVAFEVTRASAGEQPAGRALLKELGDSHEDLLRERCEVLLGDKGYDDGRLIGEAWDGYRVKAVIPIRNLWKDGESTRRVEGTRNVVYNARGDVFCCCLQTGELRAMYFAGFEKDRETLKYRCPAAEGGAACPGSTSCPIRGAVRIPLSEDRRIFTPVARTSRRWQRLYRRRTAVERVNSRLDVSFGFERHYIRGLAKMWVRCGLALIVMLAMAVGRIKAKRRSEMRSLVKAA